jgi:hypothetical protein
MTQINCRLIISKCNTVLFLKFSTFVSVHIIHNYKYFLLRNSIRSSPDNYYYLGLPVLFIHFVCNKLQATWSYVFSHFVYSVRFVCGSSAVVRHSPALRRSYRQDITGPFFISQTTATLFCKKTRIPTFLAFSDLSSYYLYTKNNLRQSSSLSVCPASHLKIKQMKNYKTPLHNYYYQIT